MAQVQQRVLVACTLLLAPSTEARRFYPDDPVETDCMPLPVGKPAKRKEVALFDFLNQSRNMRARSEKPASAVNTLGEVPDSLWFTNRHARKAMTAEELKRGPGNEYAPRAPYWVVGAKIDGITPGFRMKDSAGRLYFVKPDPSSNPEMSTAADVIGSKAFYALGYFTPENHIVQVQRAQLKIAPEARVAGVAGRQRPMSERDLDQILINVPRNKDGSIRMLASYGLAGEVVGPFKFEGTRRDDPNDVVPHEDRRDLRGLAVFCAWLNHTDAKAGNTLDTIVEEYGIRVIRHHLIDFGAILGSDSDMAKNARFGYEYVVPKKGQAFRRMASFGLHATEWERADYPSDRAVGRFESKVFDPEKWVSNYPNPAFVSRRPDDEYWAAKQAMAFTDTDIRALVSTGQYSDERTTAYVAKTLAERRDKIGRAYFLKVLALDHFKVEGGELKFTDLAVKHGFAQARRYEVAWTQFDNEKETHAPIASGNSFQLPKAAPHEYVAAKIHAAGDPKKTVTVYVQGSRVVGLERAW